mmetsp:Transcript_12735/g.25998  ORF Transcript_12735/g.25998 Transcript_12735/m.25998 type:complete len:95 (-) Transcript_12735:1-285(-)
MAEEKYQKEPNGRIRKHQRIRITQETKEKQRTYGTHVKHKYGQQCCLELKSSTKRCTDTNEEAHRQLQQRLGDAMSYTPTISQLRRVESVAMHP